MTKLNVAMFLVNLGDRLDQMADESIRGGWSTNHVKEHRLRAMECRSMAVKLMQGEER